MQLFSVLKIGKNNLLLATLLMLVTLYSNADCLYPHLQYKCTLKRMLFPTLEGQNDQGIHEIDNNVRQYLNGNISSLTFEEGLKEWGESLRSPYSAVQESHIFWQKKMFWLVDQLHKSPTTLYTGAHTGAHESDKAEAKVIESFNQKITHFPALAKALRLKKYLDYWKIGESFVFSQESIPSYSEGMDYYDELTQLNTYYAKKEKGQRWVVRRFLVQEGATLCSHFRKTSLFFIPDSKRLLQQARDISLNDSECTLSDYMQNRCGARCLKNTGTGSLYFTQVELYHSESSRVCYSNSPSWQCLVNTKLGE